MHTFVWRETHRVEMDTCPKWVLSCVGRAMAVPNQDSPGCRWCLSMRLMLLLASDSALRSERHGNRRLEPILRQGCHPEGNRKQS